MTKVKTPKTGLTKKHWFGYMLGDWGGCMTFALMGAFVTRYYTNVLQVDTVILATGVPILYGFNAYKAFSPHSPERQSGEILIEIHLVYQFPNILSRIFILGCLVCSVHTCCLLPYYLHRTAAPSEHFAIISYHSG